MRTFDSILRAHFTATFALYLNIISLQAQGFASGDGTEETFPRFRVPKNSCPQPCGTESLL